MAASACSAVNCPLLAWRRRTDVTSIRRRSGPAIDSPWKRSLNRRPSSPASASAGASTEASTTSTFLVDRLDSALGGKPALRTMFDPLEYLVDRWSRRDQRELCCEKLLERLTSLFGTAN